MAAPQVLIKHIFHSSTLLLTRIPRTYRQFLPIDQCGVDERLRAVTVDADQVATILNTIVFRFVPTERLVNDGQAL